MVKRWLLLIAILACVYMTQAKTYAVCVGLTDYPGKSSDLHWSANDACTIKGLFETNGNAVVKLLTNAHATTRNVESAIAEMFTKAKENDAVIFFFSGHGIPGGFVCYDGILRYSAIDTAMSSSKASIKMVFADACYAGKARRKPKHIQETAETSIMYFLSSRTSETSLEKRSWRNSLFTAYLERGLRGGADNNQDRTITAKELFDFVSQGVAKASKNRQHPVMWGKFSNEMPVMTWTK